MSAVRQAEPVDVRALLSPAVRLDLRPEGTGACTCPPGTLYGSCRCPWGTMVARLLTIGYGRAADPVTLAQELGDTATFVADQISAARARSIRTVVKSWTGPARALARLLGFRSVTSLDQWAPREYAALKGRRSTD